MRAESKTDQGPATGPTPDEIEEWAAREHRRRAEWLAGPREDEKQDWARRYRRRAALGLEESWLGPAREEIDLWAEREHRRRAAWLAGPTDAEKKSWAARGRRLGTDPDSPLPPTQDEVVEWAKNEKQRREQWLAGPSEEEKQEWARRHIGGLADELWRFSEVFESEFPDTARGLLRETQLAGEGALYALARAPLALWSYFVRAGRDFESEFYDKPRRSRVPY